MTYLAQVPSPTPGRVRGYVRHDGVGMLISLDPPHEMVEASIDEAVIRFASSSAVPHGTRPVPVAEALADPDALYAFDCEVPA